MDETAKAMTIKVSVDTSNMDEVATKIEHLSEVLKEANALLCELNALASGGINLELEVQA